MARILVLLILVMVSTAFCGYGRLPWDASGRAVKQVFPELKRTHPCFFPGVNVFGSDTISFAEDDGDEAVEKRVFSFFRNGLVAVELNYRVKNFKKNTFNEQIISALDKKHGRKNRVFWSYRDKTKESRCFLWKTDQDVVLAISGHFKGITPENLDWVKVKYFKRRYFDFRNQRRYCGNAQGVSKIFFR